MARYKTLRGARMKKLFEIAMTGGRWTVPDFAQKSGISAENCYHAVTRLVNSGYLLKVDEIERPCGGMPVGVYKWSGKNSSAPQETTAAHIWHQCMAAMVSCGRLA